MIANPRYRRYAERLQQLIDEGQAVAKLEKPHGRSSAETWIGGDDVIRLQAWLGNVNNLLEAIFSAESPQTRHFREILPRSSLKSVEHSYDVLPIVGVLLGALSDLENGFLAGQEYIVAGVVFDSVLEQARHLNQTGHKDPAAVLARVVIENALKRIATTEGIDSTQTASRINDELKENKRYSQPQWRQIQAWLDIGNAAAHGSFGDYDKQQLNDMLNGIEQFLAIELRV